MKKFISLLLILCLFLPFAQKAKAAVAFVASANAGCSGSCTATTSGVDTTGSTLLVAVVIEYVANPATATVSDSNGNTWHHLTTIDDSANSGIEQVIWYAYDHGGSALVVGPAHTFSVNGTSYPGINVQTFSGTQTSSDPFDVQNGNKSTPTSTIQPGSITPSANGELVFTGIETFVANTLTYTIDSGFSSPQTLFYNGNLYIGTSYLVQSTAAAVNPTWTDTNTASHVTTIASFKASSGGGGGTPAPSTLLNVTGATLNVKGATLNISGN